MTDKDTTAGDLRMLSLAVKALIDTHPDKKALHAVFKGYVDAPESAGAYTEGMAALPRDITLLQSMFKSAYVKD